MVLISAAPGSIRAGTGVPGETGSKVTSLPEVSVATHSRLEGQARAISPDDSIGGEAGGPGGGRVEVTSSPDWSSTVHCVAAGHAIATSVAEAPSMATGAAPAGALGLNVTSRGPC